jgi:NADH:ubiquinone oxidoreductase subunit 5 (subunit L)/multisubunit Na+/H+ antiporter MnhA subunit
MEQFIQLFILLPFAAFIISLFIPEKKEVFISFTAFLGIALNTLTLIAFSIFWLLNKHQALNISELVLYQSNHYVFAIDFYFDVISLIYLLVGSILTLMVTVYSRYYLHRETGYKRYFNTILFFFTGYSITVLSGNFETLFLGWEILGISSFLLIAFYRHRYLPVKNGIKVFSIYRIGDVGILLAMWMSHHLWHENITFIKLNNYNLVHEQLQSHSAVGIFISLTILIAAAAKSAQLPFSSWLPRAMEGPTPSSAIFYGSLSVHIGVFLLFRTYPFWEHQYVVRVIIAMLGLSTAIITTLIARVQSSVKSQIAYASAAQIGIIFIEVALGWHILALIHFAGNAFLRTYQLLVSPSLVSYLIKEQFYHFEKPLQKSIPNWQKRIKDTVYMLSIKEFNLDWYMYRYVWGSLKTLGKKIDFLKINQIIIVYTVLFTIGMYMLYHQQFIPASLKNYMSIILAAVGLKLVLKSFIERKNVYIAWFMIVMNHAYMVLSVSYNEQFNMQHAIIYMSGVIISGVIGYACLYNLKRKETNINLNNFYGYAIPYPKTAFIFLMACLGLSGFPITATFIGEDLLFSHIHQNQLLLASLVSISIILDGITLIRMYARLFLGPYVKQPLTRPYRSS